MENTYPDGTNYVCADCGHEWPMVEAAPADETNAVVKDANGNVLSEGDSVVLIKDLKVKGSSVTLKRDTLFKGVHLTGNEEEIECRSDKIKGLVLKTEFVKKV